MLSTHLFVVPKKKKRASNFAPYRTHWLASVRRTWVFSLLSFDTFKWIQSLRIKTRNKFFWKILSAIVNRFSVVYCIQYCIELWPTSFLYFKKIMQECSEEITANNRKTLALEISLLHFWYWTIYIGFLLLLSQFACSSIVRTRPAHACRT